MDEGDEPTERLTDRTGRGADGRFISTPDTAERDAAAARLFARGRSYRQIATELGYASPSSAYDAVDRAFRAIRAPAGEVAKAAALERLQMIRAEAHDMATAARQVLGGRHLVTNNQGVVQWDGEPLEDDGPKLAAIDRILAAQRMILAAEERESKLLGLDAEQKVNVSGEVKYEVVGVDPADLT